MSIEYYNKNSKKFFLETFNLDLLTLYSKFIKFLPPHAHILDAGCGSGRDSKFFTSKGYKVTAFDASQELVKLATHFTGLNILRLGFDEIQFSSVFDAIWANASLLHLPKNEISNVFEKLINSLKPKGVMFVSFKYGTSQRILDGRLFNDFTEISFVSLINTFRCLNVEELWTSNDSRKNRENERWLNAILKKHGELDEKDQHPN